MVDFDFKSPDYPRVFAERMARLKRIRKEPDSLPYLKLYYRDHIAQFITDWGCTIDPRNVERGLPAIIPFVLFEKQIEWVDWLISHWKTQKDGLTEKSRDMGVSWLAVSTSCALCLFNQGMGIGFGSRKEEYVDKIGSPKSLFYKARAFMQNLPVEFRGGWVSGRDDPHLRMNFPETTSNMSGEAGDNIGRGDRQSIYFIDEAAYLEHPDLIEASLSQTTNCRMDIGSPNGMGNPFAHKRFNGKTDVFTFNWRDDPRKDQSWYERQVEEIDNPIIVAQEIDIDYMASVEGVVIPGEWIRAALDAHKVLGLAPNGTRTGALDVADEGKDKNAFVAAHGFLVEYAEEWSGKGGDIFQTVEKSFRLCDELELESFQFDSDGLGAGVRGDARVINDRRRAQLQRAVEIIPFRGSEAPFDPEGEDEKGRKNKDFFKNRKAQGWWSLRKRFRATYRAVVEKKAYDASAIISISSDIPCHRKLMTELSQPTYSIDGTGKVVIDKQPEGMPSPNLADGLMIKFATVRKRPILVTPEMIARASLRAG